MTFDVVIPTVGRESLQLLLEALARSEGPRPQRVIVVADGADVEAPGAEVIRGRGAGPAAARNVGWRAATAEWVAFLDDDVVPRRDWLAALVTDLEGLPPSVAGSQGRIRVPLPADRRPTDWERDVAGLERAVWATADMAFRRDALAALAGFDERFPRAYREDADLALRLLDAGYDLVHGRRVVEHPVGPGSVLQSVRRQAGNADDALMRRLHGPGWRERAHAPRGRFRVHAAVAAAGLGAVAAAAAGRPRGAGLIGAAWLGATLEFAAARIAPGPRTAREVATMLVTSALIPPVAAYQRAAGVVGAFARDRLPDAVLLDRDGTLVVDVPYNGDPEQVVPVDGARAALDRLRGAGIPLGVVTNQSGVGRGLLTEAQLAAVNSRVEALLGPFDSWAVCTHQPDDACACRKPAPGLVARAADALGADPARCIVIGDIGADVEAARAAGAGAILVPNDKTRREEVAAAPVVAASLTAAVDLVLAGRA